jgi:hypothetical protein
VLPLVIGKLVLVNIGHICQPGPNAEKVDSVFFFLLLFHSVLTSFFFLSVLIK